jgi:glycosyltransferase involved in cell wall biosynthesis
MSSPPPGTEAAGRERILFVIESLGGGGAEAALMTLVREMTRRGHACAVAALWAPYTLEERLAGTGAVVHHLDLRHRRDAARAVARLLRVSRRFRPTVVASHLFFAGLYVAATRPLDRDPTRVQTFHNLDYVGDPAESAWQRARRSLDRTAMRHGVHGHSAVSTAVAEHMRSELGLGDIPVIENGIELPELDRLAAADPRELLGELGVRADVPLLVCPARLAVQKGHEHLIAAAAMLGGRGLAFHLILAGVGPREAEIRGLVHEHALDERITLTGHLPHAALVPLIRSAHAVVLSSLYEGLPVAVTEAQALGTTVIATRVGGVPEQVDHERNGLLVAPGDAGALADAMARVLTDDDLRRRLETESLRSRARADIGRAAAEYEQLFATVRRHRRTLGHP